ncbi:penicillin-binding protein activator [Aliiglaciecola litoralis]|uniref:Penicillin-binding protein activator n=1 Tax=Aliiglaciecola litoralis TaxID=582857 RepID=A0ABN1LGC7_9ALTE
MQNVKCLMLGVGLVYLVGCGSTSKAPAQPTSNQTPIAQSEEPALENPDYYLQQAQRSYAQTNDRTVRNQWIVRAAEAFKQQNDCEQSRKVVLISLPELDEPALRNQAHILLAECELQNEPVDWVEIAQQLNHVDPSISHFNRAMRLFSAHETSQQRWLAAATSLVAAYDGDPKDSETIWYLLQRLNEKELQTASLRVPELAPWLQLSLLVREYGLQTQTFANAVVQWQAQYPQHPLSLSLPLEVQAGVKAKPLKAQKIAILLPLSGRLEQQGLAIKEGALSAYLEQHQHSPKNESLDSPVLHFFDSQANDMATLISKVSEYDVVIGPLMKDKLAEFVDQAPMHLNIVGLNRLELAKTPVALEPVMDEIATGPSADSTELDPMKVNEDASAEPGLRIFFALSPEDEAIQLAQKVFRTGAKSPIVMSQSSGAAKRMADTFIQTWQNLNKDKQRLPGLATYTDSKSMRNSLTALLDVKQSRERIDQIEGLSSEQIHSVPRNRRDIDAIILFATPEETELLNPIVEASLSPFDDKVVPVYASSRSFSENFSNNSLRDLRNITFTDMPWMLPGHNHQTLKSETVKIWPERDDTLKRLFALGYDAFSVLPNIAALSSMPQISVNGLTGLLSVDQMGNIVRVMPFGKITENEVILLALD